MLEDRKNPNVRKDEKLMPVFHVSVTSFLHAQEVVACALTSVQNYQSFGGSNGLVVPHAGRSLPPRRAAVESFATSTHKFPNASTFFWYVDGDIDDEEALSCDFSLQCDFQLLLYPHGNVMCSREDHVSLYLVAKQSCFVTFELALGGVTKILCHRFTEGEMWGEGTFGPRPEEWCVRVSVLEKEAQFRVVRSEKGSVWHIDNMWQKLRWARRHDGALWFLSDEMEIGSDVMVQMALCLNPWGLFLKGQRGMCVPRTVIELKDDDGHYVCFRIPAHTFSLEDAFIGRSSLEFDGTSNLQVTIAIIKDGTNDDRSSVVTMPLF